MMHLLALTITLLGELIVLSSSLWLLFRSLIASAEFPHAG